MGDMINAGSGGEKSYRERVLERKRQVEQPEEKSGGTDIPSSFVMQCLNANELGDGLIFASIHRDTYLFAHNLGEWLEWNGHYWELDHQKHAARDVEDVALRYLEERERIVGEIGQAASQGNKDLLARLEAQKASIDRRVNRLRSNRGQANTLAMAHTCRDGLGISGNELDEDPYLLACANGVIDLRTGQHRPGRREDFLTKASLVEWQGIEAPADIWKQTLSQIFNHNQDLVEFVRRAFGYSLLGLHRESAFFVFSGQGRNGKSLIVETIRRILNTLAGPIPSELLLDQGRTRSSTGPTPDLMTLRGLRLAFAQETDEGQKISPARVKWLTGGDVITGRNPHDKYNSSFVPTHTLFLLTNHRPVAPADDFAFWERLYLVPFAQSFVDREPRAQNEHRQDKDLKQKLQAEAPGILAWLVRGCLEYMIGGLNPPPAVKEATSEYRRDEDILADFIEDCCIVDEKTEADATQLYKRFESWFEEHVGKRVWSQRAFGRAMAKKFEKIKRGTVKYLGVGLMSE